MTDPCVDPAFAIVTAVTTALRDVYRGDSNCPPDKPTTTVRFIAGDGNMLPGDGKCKEPLLWVRVQNRFRSTKSVFPAALVDDVPVDAGDVIRVLTVEIGVSRCVSTDEPQKWDTLADEALLWLQDSWRIENALRLIVCRLRTPERAVAVDTIAPIGPEGGRMACSGVAYVQIEGEECCGA